MRSTLSGPLPAYIGVDLTDRYSRQCRDIDICGLNPIRDGSLQSSFWSWSWDRPPLPLALGAVAEEIHAAKLIMVDGPQALAAKGATLRECERQSAAVGKTPDSPPPLTQPFAGFIRSSLDLFGALRRAGIVISSSCRAGGIFEVYPGHIWNILSVGLPLPRKSTEGGRLARKRILETLGVCGLPCLPSHDQNDACVAALLGAAADHHVLGLDLASIGAPSSMDEDGVWREGPMIVPVVTRVAADRIETSLRGITTSKVVLSKCTDTASAADHGGAEGLLAYFVEKAVEGDPHVCTYGWAYQKLFNSSYEKFSMAYAQKAVQVASRTRPRELAGLGFVRLDTFIVSKRERLPSHGYWSAAHHDEEEWARVLGNATLLD
jgi:hypothetical protein